MQFISYLKSKLPFYVALSFTFILASCGSYQYVGYDNDGIYGSEDVGYEQPSYNETPNANNSSYYKNYFAEKSQQFENIPQEGAIFTDIDSYQGDYDEVQDSTYVSGYAGWGEDSDDVTINVYPSYASSYWWYRPYAWNYWYRPYNSYYGWSYYGYNPYWYSPYSWYSPYYYGGYYGFSYYWPSWYYYRSYYYGYGNHYYYNGYGYNRYYGSRNVAYNAGRRGAVTNYSTNRSANLTNRTTSLNRRSSSIITRRNSNITRPRSSVNYTTRR
ncbi:MAG TPA: hypothetical protein VJ945_05255, partial [Flavobacteriaceae bacterium]|nr:hypothetical protein [Flavobacteriaceae bacterium]